MPKPSTLRPGGECDKKSGQCPLWVISGHEGRQRHVPFTPESGHSRCKMKCPLRANSGHRHALFDNFVGANKESSGNGHTESVGRFDVDHQFELGRL